MIVRITILFLVFFLSACSGSRSTGAGEGQLYSYVDAQGNLVTMQRSPGEAEKPATEAEDGEKATGSADEESYQTPEEVEKRIEERQRDRFISYRGPEGEIVTRPLDLVAEREAREKRPAPFEPVDLSGQYMETVSRVPADCCQTVIESAGLLEAGNEKQLRFSGGEAGWIRLDQRRPAVALRLDPETGSLQLRSFIHDQQYFSPRLLLLDEQGVPVLKVDNIFTRRYPENWHRFGYFQGELPLAPGQTWVVLYLPYAIREEGDIATDGSQEGVLEDGARPALQGELVIRARAGRRSVGREPGNQSP